MSLDDLACPDLPNEDGCIYLAMRSAILTKVFMTGFQLPFIHDGRLERNILIPIGIFLQFIAVPVLAEFCDLRNIPFRCDTILIYFVVGGAGYDQLVSVPKF